MSQDKITELQQRIREGIEAGEDVQQLQEELSWLELAAERTHPSAP
jgi:hypothetical protein